MRAIAVFVLTLLVEAPLRAQSSATLQGWVFDASDAVIPGASIRVRSSSTGFAAIVQSQSGNPVNIVGSPTFGKITRTRLPTGEAGSSRQIQLAVRLWF